jgi:hypothetical protein
MYLIKTGMSKREVVELIGPPDSVASGWDRWYYKPDNHGIEFYDSLAMVVILDFPGYDVLIGDDRETIIKDPARWPLKFSANLKPTAEDYIIATYNGNLVDTLDRILMTGTHGIQLKGKYFDLMLERKQSTYSAIFVDASYFPSAPNSVHARYADYEVTTRDSIHVTFAADKLIGHTFMPTEIFLDLNASTKYMDKIFTVSGRALLPVFSAGDRDAGSRPIKDLIRDVE